MYAQEEAFDNDLKVGLVLSGGGAKGLAHIGALRVIEESGVRIDYIGGTSMGAIVGALYASGYSANELDSIFKDVDFTKLIQGYVPRSTMSFYEKQNQEKYALKLPFEKLRISFPSAISTGQNVYNLLNELLFHVNDVEDFNKLPIPFFCIATDVETGEMVKLDRGYLPLAITASGAFPSLFEPVEIENRILIDGGVVNNYPIDEVRAMGADIIIGVDVQDPLSKRDELNSATGVLLQINNYRTVNDMKNKRGETDIYVKPDIKDYSVISFDQGDSIINNGYRAALKQKIPLDSLAMLQSGELRKHYPIQKLDSFHINSVYIRGNEQYSRAYIKGKLRYDTEQYTNFQKLDQGFNTLAATNNFKSLKYVIRPNEDGYALDLHVKERTTETFLKLGVHYDDLYQTAGLINITKKHLLFKDDVASFDFILGDNLRYNFDYYIDKGFYWSLGVRSRFNTFVKDIDFNFAAETAPNLLSTVNKLDLEFDDLVNQIYMQTVWNEEFNVGLGVEHELLKIQTETVVPEEQSKLVFYNSNYLGPYAFIKFDSLDDKYFPTRGFFFDADWNTYMFGTDYKPRDIMGYSVAKLKMGFALPVYHRLSMNLFMEGGFTLGDAEIGSLDFILGGYGNDLPVNMSPFVGYEYLSFGGDSYVKTSLNLDWEFIPKSHINFMANFANADDNIFEGGEWFKVPDYTGYACGYSFESFVGPVELKYNWSPEGNNSFWSVNVGFWF
ncbi:patatin [Robertkochia solimangrovi]|nr:patatin [Robertkochia solimangrovi]